MAYLYSRTVSIASAKVPNTDQSNFPVLFSGTYSYLATLANGGKVRNSSGYDIIFTSDSAGATKLDHEIETYDAATGTVTFWVRVPTVSHTSNTVIYLWYGNSNISTSQENVTGVWDASFKGVWHCADNAATTTVVDSVGSFNGTNTVNSSTRTVTGEVGRGLTVTGTDLIGLAGAPITSTTANNSTIEAWINLSANVTSDVFAYSGNTALNGFGFIIGDGAGGSGRQLTVLAGGIAFSCTGTGSTLTLNTWTHALVTRDTTTNRLYINGSFVESATTTPSTPVHNNSLVAAANNVSTIVDEVRMSNVQRGADWIAASYNSQSDPANFYTLGTEVAGGLRNYGIIID